MFLPFSKRAKAWEPVALELRRLVTTSLSDSLDPWLLAPKVGLRVVDGSTAFDCLDPADRLHVLGDGSRDWSGGVYPEPLPDGTRLCILNPRHSARRCRITLMEEVVHAHLKHKPTTLVLSAEGMSVRDYDPQQEGDAYGIGAAALLPWSPFFNALNNGVGVNDLAEAYDVTPQLIEYRIKITGAFALYRARQRKRA